MKIPLPPLDEQRRIVEKIERLAEKIEEVRSLRLQTIKDTEALLNAEIYKVFQEVQQKGWQQKRLGDYVESDCYGTSEKTHSETLGIPILRMENLVDKGWLEKSGNTRGTNYSLPNFQPTVTHEDDQQNSDHLDSSSDHFNRLVDIAKLSREKKKLPPSQTKAIILELCQEDYLTLEQLARIIDRSIPTMRRLLKELVEEESLILKYSNKLTHPHQAYNKK